MTLDEKLIKLGDRLSNMAANDMGDLNVYEAALFHNACDAIDALIEARRTAREDKHEHGIPETGLPAHDRY